MKKIFTLFFFLNASLIFAQEDLNFNFDYAQFGYDSVSNYVEIYYSFNQNDLEINSSDSGKYVEGILRISIVDSLKKPLIDKDFRIVYHVTETDSADNKSLVGVIGFVVPKGNYDFTIEGKDSKNENHKRSINEQVKIKPFWGDKISVSDVQFASKILQDSPNKNSIFYKNTFEVIPVPSSIFGESQPVVFYYLELYNLDNVNESDTLKLQSIVYNSRGKVVSSKIKKIKPGLPSRVEVGTVVVNKFPTDTYTLVEALLDSAGNYGISSAKKFYVYNPSIIVDDSSIADKPLALGSQFSVMTEEELDNLFDESSYIAVPAEKDQYEKLATLDGKRQFMYEFWKARDSGNSTQRIESYQEYMRRVRVANQKYGNMSREGWKTDRGRVYLMYGEPSEIERFPNQVDTKPYEIWHYNELEGGVIFVFADITGFSQYTLVHSTLRGELRDDSWGRRISSF